MRSNIVDKMMNSCVVLIALPVDCPLLVELPDDPCKMRLLANDMLFDKIIVEMDTLVRPSDIMRTIEVFAQSFVKHIIIEHSNASFFKITQV